MKDWPVNANYWVMLRLKSQTKHASISRKVARSSPVSKTFELLREQNPDPKCELYYETPFQLLTSVMLSAQTTDKQVNKVMTPLYREGFHLDYVLSLGTAGLLEKIKSIGLAPTKAKHVVKMAEILKAKHGSKVPDNRTDLEALPGVGKKTASVILGELFAAPTIAVDTHVFRVSKRLGWHTCKRHDQVEEVLLKKIPQGYLPKAHHWLILLGRYTCKATSPQCESCVVATLCPKLFDKAPKNRTFAKRLKQGSTTSR